jgi:hypothetical protein
VRRILGATGFVVLLGLVFAAQPAQAQLGGASLSAEGFGLQMTYNEPQAPAPTNPTLESELAFSEADLSGAASHGLSSVAWPGPLIADGGPSFCGQAGAPFDCPAYPVRAEAFSPGKPHSSKDDQFGPNTSMAATASRNGASSSSTLQSSRQAAPAVVTGDFESSSSTAVTGDRAVAHAAAQVSDVTIAGVVHVDSIITTATAVTNGKKGTVSGSTLLGRVTVNGQAVTVDRKGVHVAGQTVPVFDPIDNGQVQQALQEAGITMQVAAPQDSVKGAHAERTLGGLEVTFLPGAFEDALPSQIGDQLKQHNPFDQTITLSIGGVTVSSDTVAGYRGYTPPPAPPSNPGGGFSPGTGSSGGSSQFGFSGGSSGAGTGAGSGLSSLGSSGSSGGAGTGTVGVSPVSAPLSLPPVKGVPAGIAIGALLAALLAGLGFKVLAERAVAAAADRCPLEELTP